MQQLPLPQVRKKLPQLAAEGYLSDNPAHFHLGLLPGRPALPVVPAERLRFSHHLTGPFDQSAEIQVQFDAAMEVGEKRNATQKGSEDGLKIRGGIEFAIADNAKRGEKMKREGVCSLADKGRIGWDRRPGGWFQYSNRTFVKNVTVQHYRIQAVFALPLADAQFSQFIKGVDEIGKVLIGPADQDQSESDRLAGREARFIVERRLYDKGMRRAAVLGHPLASYRRRSFENIAVNAAMPEQAVITLLPLEGADHLLEGMAKAAAEG